MNTQESQYLFKEKLLDGRDELRASSEVLEFRLSQIKFKKLERENNQLKKK